MKLLLTSIACAASTVALAKTVSEPVTLTADTDWRGQGVVSFTDAGSINLGGFDLWTDGISGGEDSLVDATTADASKASSSTLASGDGSAANLFDDKFVYSFEQNHRICATYEQFPCWITYDFGEPVCLGAYKIYYNACKDGRYPKTWTFEGSNDNVTWTAVDSHSDDRNWTRPCVRLFTFANSTAFRYYRLRVPSQTVDGALELYQLEYFKTPSAWVDRTVADASRVSSTSTFYSGDEKKLFDNIFKYDASTHRTALYVPFEAIYDFGSPVSVNRYRMYYKSSSNKSDRAPGTWTLAGSNDKDTWTVVDSHVNDSNWKFPDVRTFACPNPGSYRYYKIEVTAPVGGNFMELYQIEYFTGPMISAFSPDTFPVTDLTTNDATKASSSTLYDGSAANLFDNQFTYSQSSHRICANSLPVWFAYDFGKATQVNSYSIHFCSCYFTDPEKSSWRSPKSWTFEGADDPAGPWVVLDTRANVTDWIPKQARSFAFASERKFRYYRLNVAAASGDAILELYQLEFGRALGQCQLHVEVGSGLTETNRSVVLAGQLDLVKDGAGTLVAALPQQMMAGGVKVEGGVLRAGASGEESVLGMAGFGNVSVASGATFDVDSFGGWMANLIALNGGTLACSMPAVFAPTATFGSIELSADSALSVRGPLTLGDGAGAGEIDLGGHRLAVDLVDGGSLDLALTEIRNGKVSFTVDGVQAKDDVKVASWTTPPSLVNVRFVKAKVGDDGIYAYCPGFLLLFH